MINKYPISPEIIADLEARLARVRSRHPGFTDGLQAALIRLFVYYISKEIRSYEKWISVRIADLEKIISEAKQDVALLKFREEMQEKIPQATDELDEIIRHTMSATETILESAEQLDNLAGSLGAEAQEKIGNITGKIFEACSFQDITGQRITKVITMFRALENKIEQLMKMLQLENEAVEEELGDMAMEDLSDKNILNGPALPEEALQQQEIDRLLKGSDK